MIKIEFKEAQPLIEAHRAIFDFGNDDLFNESGYAAFWSDSYDLKSITPYTPTQDPMLDREHILTQLGISKEQDEQMQQKYK